MSIELKQKMWQNICYPLVFIGLCQYSIFYWVRRVLFLRLEIHCKKVWGFFFNVISIHFSRETWVLEFNKRVRCVKSFHVFPSDLGWDNWMIYPERVTLVHCAPCGHSASCRPQLNAPQRDDLQVCLLHMSLICCLLCSSYNFFNLDSGKMPYSIVNPTEFVKMKLTQYQSISNKK